MQDPQTEVQGPKTDLWSGGIRLNLNPEDDYQNKEHAFMDYNKDKYCTYQDEEKEKNLT